MQLTRKRMFVLFFMLTMLPSWLIAFAGAEYWLQPVARVLAVLHALPVLLGTLIMQGPILKQPVLAPLGLKWSPSRWWGVAWLLPIASLAAGLFYLWLVHGVSPVLDGEALVALKRETMTPENLARFDAYRKENPPVTPLWLVIQALPAGLTFNFLFGLVEEVGFRGFLFREIRGGFWTRALLSGFAWALWLTPAAYFGFPTGFAGINSVLIISVWALLSSIPLTYFRARGMSLLASGLWRGTSFALAAVAADLAFGVEPWLRPMHGVAGLVGIAFIIVLLAIVDWLMPQSLMWPTKDKNP